MLVGVYDRGRDHNMRLLGDVADPSLVKIDQPHNAVAFQARSTKSAGAQQRTFGAAGIVNAKLDAVRVAEIELGEIAVQMPLAAMLIDANHAALEDGEKALGGIAVNGNAGQVIGPTVFAARMIGRMMRGEACADLDVVIGFVGHQAAFARDVIMHDRADVLGCGALDVEAAGRTAAFDKGQNGVLVAIAAPDFLALFATDEGFIRLNDGQPTEARLQRSEVF